MCCDFSGVNWDQNTIKADIYEIRLCKMGKEQATRTRTERWRAIAVPILLILVGYVLISGAFVIENSIPVYETSVEKEPDVSEANISEMLEERPQHVIQYQELSSQGKEVFQEGRASDSAVLTADPAPEFGYAAGQLSVQIIVYQNELYEVNTHIPNRYHLPIQKGGKLSFGIIGSFFIIAGCWSLLRTNQFDELVSNTETLQRVVRSERAERLVTQQLSTLVFTLFAPIYTVGISILLWWVVPARLGIPEFVFILLLVAPSFSHLVFLTGATVLLCSVCSPDRAFLSRNFRLELLLWIPFAMLWVPGMHWFVNVGIFCLIVLPPIPIAYKLGLKIDNGLSLEDILA